MSFDALPVKQQFNRSFINPRLLCVRANDFIKGCRFLDLEGDFISGSALDCRMISNLLTLEVDLLCFGCFFCPIGGLDAGAIHLNLFRRSTSEKNQKK
jgi:hypothetical protein